MQIVHEPSGTTKVTQTGQAIRSLIRLFADQLLFVVLYMAGVVGYLLFKHPLFAAEASARRA